MAHWDRVGVDGDGMRDAGAPASLGASRRTVKAETRASGEGARSWRMAATGVASPIDSPPHLRHASANSRGRDRAAIPLKEPEPGAEGATAPETLRQKDRDGLMHAGKFHLRS